MTTPTLEEPQEGGRYERRPDGTLEVIHQTKPALTRGERLAAEAAQANPESADPGAPQE